MASCNPPHENGKAESGCAPKRKPRVLLGACGSVAAAQFARLCRLFSEWAEVKAVVTNSAVPFIGDQVFPEGVRVFCEEDERFIWRNDARCPVLHVELSRWADTMVIAPLSANTLAKIAGGLCDNLLTCIVRAWDYNKPLFVAPSMLASVWKSHQKSISLSLMISLTSVT